jgi:hypothetical protein
MDEMVAVVVPIRVDPVVQADKVVHPEEGPMEVPVPNEWLIMPWNLMPTKMGNSVERS